MFLDLLVENNPMLSLSPIVGKKEISDMRYTKATLQNIKTIN